MSDPQLPTLSPFHVYLALKGDKPTVYAGPDCDLKALAKEYPGHAITFEPTLKPGEWFVARQPTDH